MKNDTTASAGAGEADNDGTTPGTRPAGWTLTVGALYDEASAGKRGNPSKQELDWAREYERSLLSPDCRFPRRGDIYEASIDLTVHYMTFWALPFTGGGEGILRKGTRLAIRQDPIEPEPLGAYAVPLDYAKVEAELIPANDREDPKYQGFELALDTADLNRNFTLVRAGKAARRAK